ncbi:MAG TPA: winged helix DNA-binding domain-containing protein [Gaiellaceae bacterium]|nr:winged helix DNA-binding domain-containing protein [Gaiellaceae bacterium]
MRVLTLRELNRTLLLRQLLLRRERLGPARAVERLGALQAQWVPSPYVALWTRLEGFGREQLTRSLRREQVVKGSLMRGTLHLVSARDYPLYATALRKEVAPWSNGRAKPTPELVAAVRAYVRREPRAARELVAFLEDHRGPADEVENLRDLAWLRHLIPLEPMPDAAEWGFARSVRFRAATFRRPPLADALAHLVRRYLAAFGPATRADLASWSGQLLKALDSALESIRLRRFLDEDGRELLDLPRAPLADGGERAPVRLLPRWDELLIAHADRRRVLPEEHAVRKLVLGGAPAVLVDGFVAGTWMLEAGRVVVEPFSPVPRAIRRELADEAAQLEVFLS